MMSKNLSLSLKELGDYASLLGTNVIEDVSEVHYTVHHKMTDWCKNHEGIVVLENGDILTSNPASTLLHECQQYISHYGMVCGNIYPTTDFVVNYVKNNLQKNLESNLDDSISDSHHQLRAVIYSAIKVGASDIHMTIIPNIQETVVKFRINGILKLYARWTDKVGIKVHSVAYNHLSTNKQDAFSMILPQDMSFTEYFDDLKAVRIRSSNVGIKNGGCKIVYRLLSVGSENTSNIEELGYHPSQIYQLEKIRDIGSGIVLFCGETGSGKTTSLASILSNIDHRKSAYSIEDPVEKYIKNVDQCPVDTRHSKRSFSYYLRALLRLDPDVIMLGEIRDTDTAKIAIQGALTGHLILSTLHTRYAVNAVMRLYELGVPANNLATPGLLKQIVAQQLYPLLCQACARSLTSEEKEKLQNQYDFRELEMLKTSINNSNCRQCDGDGMTGRKVFAEIINIDRKGREYISNMDIRGWETYLDQQGFVSLDQRVRDALLTGEIDAFALKALEPPEVDCYQYKHS